MEKMQFKTTIKCAGCLDKVTPELNNAEGIEHWDVDLNNPDRVLTVNSDNASEEDVISAVKKVGFEIERV